MGPRGLGPKTIKLFKSLKSIKNHETNVFFFEHGKDAHRNSAKGALNDSSRSLICDFRSKLYFWKFAKKYQKYQIMINFGYIPDCPKKL